MPNMIIRENLEDKEIRFREPCAHETVEGKWKAKNIPNM